MRTITYELKDYEGALEALDGMREIVRKEMLVKGMYVGPISNPSMTRSICGGRRYCAMGALWVGGGIKVTRGDLPGVHEGAGRTQGTRNRFLRKHPALKIALNALEEVSRKYLSELPTTSGFLSPLENLFEGHYGLNLDRTDLLKVIASAKRIIRKEIKSKFGDES